MVPANLPTAHEDKSLGPELEDESDIYNQGKSTKYMMMTRMNESYMITLNMKVTVFAENTDCHQKRSTPPHLK